MRQWTLAGQALIEEAKLDIEAENEAGGYFLVEYPSSAYYNVEAVPTPYLW